DAGTDTDRISTNGTAADGAVTIVPSTGDDDVGASGTFGFANVKFEATQRVGDLSVQNGAVATLTSGGAKVLTLSLLNIGGTGRLNLTDNDMIVDYTGASPIDAVRSMLQSGFHGGAWDGNGIMSSFADASKFALGFAEASDVAADGTFAGQPIDTTAVVVKFTLYGD